MRAFLFFIFSDTGFLGLLPADTPPAETPPAEIPPPILDTIFAFGTGFDNTSFLAAETAVVSIGLSGISDSPESFDGSGSDHLI